MYIVTILVSYLLMHLGSLVTSQKQRGPSFTIEPPTLVQYTISDGAIVTCSAQGEPTPKITWLDDNGETLADITDVRRIESNGTLILYGINSMNGYRGSSVVTSSYRCKATNIYGTILSRDVILQPLSDEPWDVTVTGTQSYLGGSVLLTCTVRNIDMAHVTVNVWYLQDTVIKTGPPTAGGRYVATDKYLLIHDISMEDAVDYSCMARHDVTGIRKRSQPYKINVLSTPNGGAAVRLVTSSSDIVVKKGSDHYVICLAIGHPLPTYTWFRESSGRLAEAESVGARVWSRGTILSTRTSGSWVCSARNTFGEQRMHLRIIAFAPLKLQVIPTVQTADTGSTAYFNCSIQSGDEDNETVTISWLHDSIPVGSSARQLTLRSITRQQRGMYQCIARRGHDSAQASGELRLGDTSPELHYTFIEQVLRPGGSISLRCAASGTPSPKFTWLFDGQPLEQYMVSHRHSLTEGTLVDGEIVSQLNISGVQTSDGGRYTCRAQNTKGRSEHSARLNIYGTPSIRTTGPVHIVTGVNSTVYCPYSGYPISSVRWSRQGRNIDRDGRVWSRWGPDSGSGTDGGTLHFTPALQTDAGLYTCTVTSADGTALRRDIDVQVKNPPKVSPFIFSPDLIEGSSVQILCGVSAGDKPLYFSWLKDGAPIPASLQIQEKNLDEFSLLMFSDMSWRHSGDYTCRVSNQAAIVNYTATLMVKVPATWTVEPNDLSVLVGGTVAIECAARGYPPPDVTWFKRIGEGELGYEPITSRVEWSESRSLDTNTDDVQNTKSAWLRTGAATRAHAGVYSCKAMNNLPAAHLIQKDINITVNEPAHFVEEDTWSRNVSSRRGGPATLTCHARGDMPLTIYWTRNRARLDMHSYRVSISEVRTINGMRSVLSIRSTERDDVGTYRCHAENTYGRADITFFLHIDEPPEAPRSLSILSRGSRWIRVSWRSSAGVRDTTLRYTARLSIRQHEFNVPSQTQHINITAVPCDDTDSETIGGSKWSSNIGGLRPDTAYRLQIIAHNHIDPSEPSDVINFKTEQEEPSEPPSDVQVKPGSFGELIVSWSAPHSESFNGELIGYVVDWEETDENTVDRRTGRETVVGGWRTSRITLHGLKPSRSYRVTVRAYNSLGAGPHSTAVIGTTSESVPEGPPQSVLCEPVSGHSIRVQWLPPPINMQAGLIRGYDVLHLPIRNNQGWSRPGPQHTVRTVNTEVVIQGVTRDANYSIRVRARTAVGHGPSSEPIYCVALDDVPESPSDISAACSSSESVMVWWSTSSDRSRILYYTLHIREAGSTGSNHKTQRVVPTDEMIITNEVHGLRERQLYEFWATATNANGLSEPSIKVTAAPNSRAPARIASSSRVVTSPAGSRVRLRCLPVGRPPPFPRWTPLPPPHAHTITEEGDLILLSATRTQSGNFTCSVRNSFGEDSVTYSVSIISVPEAPEPRIIRSAHTSLDIEWDQPADGGSDIYGYLVSVSKASTVDESSQNVWSEWISSDERSVRAVGLTCGTRHKIKIQAFNTAGSSKEHQPFFANTLGDKPQPSPTKEFIWSNSTYARVNLLSWREGGCSITSWSVSIRRIDGNGSWRDTDATADYVHITGLQPSTWYQLKVEATSAAGVVKHVYTFSTLTEKGGPAPGPVGKSSADTSSSNDRSHFTLMSPALLGTIAAILFTVVALMVAVIVMKSKHLCLKKSSNSRVLGCNIDDDNRLNSQLYTSSPSKINGKQAELHDISPYATFSMATSACGVCPLHVRGRAEPLGLNDAPPPSHISTQHRRIARDDYRRDTRERADSDTESSGSPCMDCGDKILYRLPHNTSDIGTVVVGSGCIESSAESSSGGVASRSSIITNNIPISELRVPARRRRDPHIRTHSAASSISSRYLTGSTMPIRQ